MGIYEDFVLCVCSVFVVGWGLIFFCEWAASYYRRRRKFLKWVIKSEKEARAETRALDFINGDKY